MARVRGWRLVWGVIVFCGMTSAIPSAARVMVTLPRCIHRISRRGHPPFFPCRFSLKVQTETSTGQLTPTGPRMRKALGTIFKMISDGVNDNLVHFLLSGQDCTDGAHPRRLNGAGFPKGDLYGTTAYGGTGPNCGLSVGMRHRLSR